jgi:ABC-type antimicrobial peptide transport system permease subunit
VVVLSYTYWNNRFARDPGVVGKKILVNDFPMTIIGVSAAGFAGLDPARSPQIRVPVQMKEAMLPEWPWLYVDNRRARWFQVFARAQPASVIWLVMREVLLLLGIGLAVGIPAAMAAGRYISAQLYGIQPNDPFIAISTTVLLAVVSAAAGLIPARRASRIDPILALRHE